jgi:hypothetical protein
MLKKLKYILILPFEDFLSGLERAIGKSAPVNIALLVLIFAVTWWIYVPIHELCHAFGCILGGGTVTEREISPKYGGAILQKDFSVRSQAPNTRGSSRVRYGVTTSRIY